MTIAQDIYQKVQNMPAEKAQIVLEFVDFLRFQSRTSNNSGKPVDITQYAGMIDLPKTNTPRSLDSFNPADIFTNKENIDESH